MNKFEGPIPGENYTSDTKNYPWHRPPEFNDLDLAIDYIGKKLTKEDAATSLLTMVEAGIPLSELAQLFLMSGIGNGKWTLDFALLLAGPVTHIMMIMAKAYGIKYELGIDGEKPSTGAFFKVTQEINRAKAAAAGRSTMDQIDDIETDTSNNFKTGSLVNSRPTPKFTPRSSFAKADNPSEQQAMLGQSQTPSTEMDRM